MIQYTNSLALIVAACVGVSALGAGVAYHYEAGKYASDAMAPLTANTLPGKSADQSIPTPAYLIAHPAALSAAELQCQNSVGPNVVAICDNVHSAESELLADQYRNAAAGKTQ